MYRYKILAVVYTVSNIYPYTQMNYNLIFKKLLFFLRCYIIYLIELTYILLLQALHFEMSIKIYGKYGYLKKVLREIINSSLGLLKM